MAENSEKSDSTENFLLPPVYSADHNLPDAASSTATVYRIGATNLVRLALDLYFIRQDFVADL